MTVGQVRPIDLPNTGSIDDSDVVMTDAEGGSKGRTIAQLRAKLTGSGAVAGSVTTTDATPTTVLTLTPTNNAITRYRLSAVCGKASLNEYAGIEILVVVSKAAGVPTIASGYGHLTSRTAGIPAADLSASVSGANVLVQVVGAAATTLKWQVLAESIEVAP